MNVGNGGLEGRGHEAAEGHERGRAHSNVRDFGLHVVVHLEAAFELLFLGGFGGEGPTFIDGSDGDLVDF